MRCAEVDLMRRLRQETPLPVAPCTHFDLCVSDGHEDQAENVNTEKSICALARRLRSRTALPVAAGANFEVCVSDGRKHQAEIVNTENPVRDQMILEAWTALQIGSIECESAGPDGTEADC